jgi:hypothetical protein
MHQSFSVFVLEHDRTFPEVRVYPEDRLQQVTQLAGFEDIELESLEFSNAFVVKSKDKKFAYDVCHTRMMELLLQHREVSLEIEKNAVCLSFPYSLKVSDIQANLDFLVQVRERLPRYLMG